MLCNQHFVVLLVIGQLQMKFQRIPHISPSPDSVMMLPTWSEIGGHPELKMAAMKTGGENNF